MVDAVAHLPSRSAHKWSDVGMVAAGVWCGVSIIFYSKSGEPPGREKTNRK